MNTWERFTDSDLDRMEDYIRSWIIVSQTCDVCDKTMPLLAFAEGSTICVYCVVEQVPITRIKWRV